MSEIIKEGNVWLKQKMNQCRRRLQISRGDDSGQGHLCDGEVSKGRVTEWISRCMDELAGRAASDHGAKRARAPLQVRAPGGVLSLHLRLSCGFIRRRFAEIHLALTRVIAHVIIARAVPAHPKPASEAVILVLVLGVPPALVPESVHAVLAQGAVVLEDAQAARPGVAGKQRGRVARVARVEEQYGRSGRVPPVRSRRRRVAARLGARGPVAREAQDAAPVAWLRVGGTGEMGQTEQERTLCREQT